MIPAPITGEKNSLWDLWSKTKLDEWRLINMLSNQMAGLQFLHSRFPSSSENCSAILACFSTLAAFKGVIFGFQNFPASFAGRRFLGIEIHPSEKLPWLRKLALHIFLLPEVLSSRIALSLSLHRCASTSMTSTRICEMVTTSSPCWRSFRAWSWWVSKMPQGKRLSQGQVKAQMCPPNRNKSLTPGDWNKCNFWQPLQTHPSNFSAE